MSLALHSDHYRPEDKADHVEVAPEEAAPRNPPRQDNSHSPGPAGQMSSCPAIASRLHPGPKALARPCPHSDKGGGSQQQQPEGPGENKELNIEIKGTLTNGRWGKLLPSRLSSLPCSAPMAAGTLPALPRSRHLSRTQREPRSEPSALHNPGAGPAVLTAKCKGLTGMVLSTSSRQLKDISRSCNSNNTEP